MRKVLLALGIICLSAVHAQTGPSSETQKFYLNLNAGDAIGLRDFFAEDLLVTHYEDDTTYSFDLEGFLDVCPKFKSGMFREEFAITDVISHPKNTYVSVDFDFYLGWCI